MSNLLKEVIESSIKFNKEIKFEKESNLKSKVSDEFIKKFKNKLNHPTTLYFKYMYWYYGEDGNLSEEQKDWIRSEGFVISDVCFIGRKNVIISW